MGPWSYSVDCSVGNIFCKTEILRGTRGQKSLCDEKDPKERINSK